MSAFTDAEINYLTTQRLGRWATVGADGHPHVVPVGFRYNPKEDAIEIGKTQMSWTGKWQNQCGSTLEITDESNHRIIGKFRTALADSGFFGKEIEVIGVHHGDCIGLTAGGAIWDFARIWRVSEELAERV